MAYFSKRKRALQRERTEIEIRDSERDRQRAIFIALGMDPIDALLAACRSVP